MGLRFHKSLKLSSLLKVNLSKSGASLSVGKRGATINIGSKGIKNTVGLPGSGFSYSQYKSYNKLKPANQNDNGAAKANNSLTVFVGILIVVCVILALSVGN